MDRPLHTNGKRRSRVRSAGLPKAPVTAASTADGREALPSHWRSPAILPTICIIATGGLVAAGSVVALAITVFDGNLVAVMMVAAGLAGGWLVPLTGLGHERWQDRLMIGMGLGVGTLATAVLVLGSMGMLTRPVAIGLVVALAVAALLRVAVELYRAMPANAQGQNDAAKGSAKPTLRLKAQRRALALSGWHYLWLLACPFLALTLLAATLPPGILWAEEAGGYDVLEYHLAVPKEYFEAGHIFFMPYNAYSNMPANSGMIWLLTMTLRGDAIEAAPMTQLANVALAGLFVAAAWWTGRLYSRKAGIAAGVLAATTPWLAYLAGIAYDEPGMLAMGMLSLGAMLRGARAERSARGWTIAAGLLAGLSCGFKYTAVPMIAAPIATLALFAERSNSRPSVAERLGRLLVFTLAAMAAFSPWMIRNVVNTGNPVFPLAYNIFGAKKGVWDADLNARWQSAHGSAGSGLKEGESKLVQAFDRTIGDARFGIVLVILAVAGTAMRRDRWTLALLLMLAMQAAVWFSETHLFARFAVVLLLPTIPLAARVCEKLRSRLAVAIVAAALVASAGLNLYGFSGLYYAHTHSGVDGKPLAAQGHMDWFTKGEWPGAEYLSILNQLGKGSRVMLVGEARTFYLRTPREYATAFNHHPLSEAVARLMPEAQTQTARGPQGDGSVIDARDKGARAVLAWLRHRGITHVLVHWAELDRLRRTYGMDPRLNRRLFAELQSAGLLRMGDFSLQDGLPPYSTLYEVPHE